jgi:hypothetical protein
MDGVVTLKKGKGVLAIGFSRGAALPEGGVVYQPGKIVITGGEKVRMAPLEIDVGLRLALAKVAVEPSEMQLEAKPTPTASPIAKVMLTPPYQPNTGIGKIRLELRRPAGQESAETSFAAEELWLQPAGDPLAPPQRAQTLSVDLGAEFQVYLHPQKAKEPGKHLYEIAVSGRGIDEARAPLVLSVDAPVLQAREDRAELMLDPGASATANFDIRLQGLSADAQRAHLRLPPGSAVAFQNVDPAAAAPELELRLTAPDAFNPLSLPPPDTSGQAPWTSFPIRVEVPEDAPFGRYRASLVVTSANASDLTLTLEVVVNSLLVELPSLSEEGESGWRPMPEAPILQFLGREMAKTFRVRTGTGDPLAPEQIEISPLEPFGDEAGDSMRLPQVASVTAKDDGLVVRLLFPKTPNAHVDLPYRVQVEVRSPTLQLKPATAAFRVRFWDPLDFFDQGPRSSSPTSDSQ